jgi:hypothetical protein
VKEEMERSRKERRNVKELRRKENEEQTRTGPAKEKKRKREWKKTDQIRDRFLTPHLFSSAGSCHRHLQSNHPVLHREAQPPTPPSAASPIAAGVPVYNPTPPGPHRRKLPLPHLCSAAPLCCDEEDEGNKNRIEEMKRDRRKKEKD